MVKGRDTLVEYVSNEGERVKVVSGRYLKKYGRGTGVWSVSTRVYVGRELVEEYDSRSGEINNKDIPLIRPQLEVLADGGASSREIVSLLDDYAFTFYELREHAENGFGDIPWFGEE
ncbi:hypothetical protein K8R30_03740 [archaeon]|nr:hypothetical protein [archaeon]